MNEPQGNVNAAPVATDSVRQDDALMRRRLRAKFGFLVAGWTIVLTVAAFGFGAKYVFDDPFSLTDIAGLAAFGIPAGVLGVVPVGLAITLLPDRFLKVGAWTTAVAWACGTAFLFTAWLAMIASV